MEHFIMSFSAADLETKRATFMMQRDQILGQYNQLCGAIYALDELIKQMQQTETEGAKNGEEIHSGCDQEAGSPA
jgi:hypothetical protein